MLPEYTVMCLPNFRQMYQYQYIFGVIMVKISQYCKQYKVVYFVFNRSRIKYCSLFFFAASCWQWFRSEYLSKIPLWIKIWSRNSTNPQPWNKQKLASRTRENVGYVYTFNIAQLSEIGFESTNIHGDINTVISQNWFVYLGLREFADHF